MSSKSLLENILNSLQGDRTKAFCLEIFLASLHGFYLNLSMRAGTMQKAVPPFWVMGSSVVFLWLESSDNNGLAECGPDSPTQESLRSFADR